MLLERRIPEILGKVLLTDGEADGGSAGVARKDEREADLDGRAVRPFAFALETHGIRDADPRLPKARRVRRGVVAFEDHQRKPLLIFQKEPVEGAEQRREAVASELLGFRHGQQFDEESGKLHEVVVGAPRMPVARSDGEAEPVIELGGRVEIAHRMDHMVEAAGHVPLLYRRERGRLQEHVLDRSDDRPITLALGALGQPFRIAREFVPLGLALGERLPSEKVVQVLIAAVADQNGPEPGLPDAVPLPQLERRGLEALQQRGQPPGHTVINPQFVDHGSPLDT
jgi:hypothetical protein